mgnify:CR=1 FL=1|jgi:hypothetical protein|tara:strand:+ start:12124 stop:12570 length:447 start_codon:yes stop_codon:yes gene_type:complete
MLAELALCSAAYNTVKEFVQNGKELHEMGAGLFNYFDAKSNLQKKVNRKSGNKDELEEFLALEQIKAQEDELRELMIYTGRPGMWQDWISFQAQASENRKEKERERIRAINRRQQKIYAFFEVVGYTLLIATTIIVACYFGYLYYVME